MKLDDSRRSDNVEDERGSGLGRGAGIGIGTIVIVVIGYFMGVSPSTLLSLLNGGDPQAVTQSGPAESGTAAANDPQVDFVRAVLGETEDVWGAYFSDHGKAYVRPKLVLFSGQVSSACGFASAASGPFYCPGDRRVYLDLSFFRQLATQFAAPGDFARAYVIAHEVGHHVQNLLGITDTAAQAEERAGRVGANRVSVKIELQADCFAGVWAARANAARKILEPGDLEQGLNAASSVGDDTLQKREQGTVVPDSFTHGTSAQRVAWFRRGFDSGNIDNCDTFSAGVTPAPP
ncbi:MAG TPA: neutral zinc metallopeptidase [Steroidobacteraceae bacterium]|jgi:predicted metalloprotease|nr:neutral zinc metallopeptidase [Steroidobacteraceae bacterium]